MLRHEKCQKDERKLPGGPDSDCSRATHSSHRKAYLLFPGHELESAKGAHSPSARDEPLSDRDFSRLCHFNQHMSGVGLVEKTLSAKLP